MIIRWLDSAINDLQALRHYIAQDSNLAAARVVKKIFRAVEMLAQHPGMGREGRVETTRELIISGTPYIVPYRVKNNVIEILRVFHCAMEWPESL